VKDPAEEPGPFELVAVRGHARTVDLMSPIDVTGSGLSAPGEN
jgi:hypothetical protein